MSVEFEATAMLPVRLVPVTVMLWAVEAVPYVVVKAVRVPVVEMVGGEIGAKSMPFRMVPTAPV